MIAAVTRPKINEVELARRLIKFTCGSAIVLMMGFNELITPNTVEALGIRELLTKSFTPQDLAEKVRKALHAVIPPAHPS